MAGATTPDGYAYPTTGDTFALQSDLATMATSSQTAMLAHAVTVTNISALDALATSAIGAVAFMTTPGTGVESLKWEAYSGSGSSLKWHIVDTVRVDTVAHLATFISAVAATSDLSFVVGGRIYISGTASAYMFTSTAGAYTIQTPGSMRVIPTSATGGTLGASGAVTMSAASTISVDGCFSTANGQRYIVEIDGVASTAANFAFIFRSGGSDVTSANYDRTENLARNATVSSATSAGQTSWATNGAAVLQKIKMELSYPAVAQATTGIGMSAFMANPQVSGVGTGLVQNAFSHRLSTAYDGFKITLSSGTFTGVIHIYAENDN